MKTRVYDVSELLDEPGDAAAEAGESDPTAQHLARERASLESLRKRMGDQHPDVRSLEEKIKATEEQLRSARTAGRRAGFPQQRDARMNQLIELVEQTVLAALPEHPLLIKGFKNKLVVTADEQGQRAVEDLLKMLDTGERRNR